MNEQDYQMYLQEAQDAVEELFDACENNENDEEILDRGKWSLRYDLLRDVLNILRRVN